MLPELARKAGWGGRQDLCAFGFGTCGCGYASNLEPADAVELAQAQAATAACFRGRLCQRLGRWLAKRLALTGHSIVDVAQRLVDTCSRFRGPRALKGAPAGAAAAARACEGGPVEPRLPRGTAAG